MAHVQKRDGSWQARYRDPAGREHARRFARKVDALQWLATIEVSKGRGEWLDPALGRQTFAAWVGEWAGTTVDLRASTLERDASIVRNHLLPRFGPMPLAKITSTEVRTFVAEMLAASTHSPATVRKVGQILAKVMSSAVDAGLIGRSPCTGVRLPAEGSRQMRFLDPDEIEELADAMPEHYRPLVFTAAYAGLRWGELAGLKVERIDLLRQTITVTEQLTEVNGTLACGPPKTAAGRRTVNVSRFLVEMLADRLCEPLTATSGLVFPSPEGTPMRRSNFRRRAWSMATRRAGLEGLRFHDLRHTAVALAIAQGAHAKAIQERMGHSSVTVTLDRYGHLLPALDERIADGLEEARRLAVAARADKLRTAGGQVIGQIGSSRV